MSSSRDGTGATENDATARSEPDTPSGTIRSGLSQLGYYFRRFLRYKRALILGFCCIPLANLADIGVTVLIGNAIDRMEQAEGSGTGTAFMQRVLLLIALAALAHAVFRFLQRWLIVVVSRRFEVDLKQKLFDKLVELDFHFHNQSRSGDVVSRMTSDVENLRMFLGPGLMYSIGAAVVVPISLTICFMMNPLLAGVMLLPMVGMGLAMKMFSPSLHRHSVAVQESLADISHRAQENFSGVRVVKGYAREEQQAQRFEHSSGVNRDNQILLAKARGWTHAAVHGANELTFIVILTIAGFALISGQLSSGELFKFIDLTLKVFWPLIALGWIAGMFPRALASAERVRELESRETPIQDPEPPARIDNIAGFLSLEGVSYTYPDATEPALSGIDVSVAAGGTLGIVGPTGSGKTTLLHLIGRVFDAEGTIRLDGIPIEKLLVPRLRGAIGYVPQDSFLFSETFRDNVAFGVDDGDELEEFDDEELARLVDRACLAEEVATFPDGTDQLIGERGVTLSGGQRQRTCIARALAKDPRVLVLDDCLSAVDTETEKLLIENLRMEAEGRTVVIAAHRLRTVRNADTVLVLGPDGRPAEIGTHDELIEREGWYRDTWRRQEQQELLSELAPDGGAPPAQHALSRASKSGTNGSSSAGAAEGADEA